MPLVQVKLIEGVFSDAQKQEMIRKLTDAMVSIEGEAMREVTWVVVEEVKSGSWGIGGKALTTGDIKQRPAKELKSRRFPITPLQFGQEQRPVLLGACPPHDRAPVPRLGLARRLAGGPIRQQVVHSERTGMRRVGVQRQHQRRPFQDQANPRMAMTVDPPLVALG